MYVCTGSTQLTQTPHHRPLRSLHPLLRRTLCDVDMAERRRRGSIGKEGKRGWEETTNTSKVSQHQQTGLEWVHGWRKVHARLGLGERESRIGRRRLSKAPHRVWGRVWGQTRRAGTHIGRDEALELPGVVHASTRLQQQGQHGSM